MSGSGGGSRRLRLGRLGVAGSRRQRGRAGWRRTRFARVCPSSTSRSRWERTGCGVRARGARRPRTRDPGLLDALRALVGDDVRGDPERVLLWTSKSVRNLADELGAQWSSGRQRPRCSRLLKGKLGFSLQAARKTLEGKQHPDRDAQFRPHQRRRSARRSQPGSPRSASTPRRRSWSASSRTAGASGIPRARRRRVNTYDFPSMADGQGDPLRGLRHRREHRLVIGRHRPRHRAVLGRGDPGVVAAARRTARYPERPAA